MLALLPSIRISYGVCGQGTSEASRFGFNPVCYDSDLGDVGHRVQYCILGLGLDHIRVPVPGCYFEVRFGPLPDTFMNQGYTEGTLQRRW